MHDDFYIKFLFVLFQMGRSKKKRLKFEKSEEESTDMESAAIPIKNLAEKFICMHVSLWDFQVHATLFDFTHVTCDWRWRAALRLEMSLTTPWKNFPIITASSGLGSGKPLGKLFLVQNFSRGSTRVFIKSRSCVTSSKLRK